LGAYFASTLRSTMQVHMRYTFEAALRCFFLYGNLCDIHSSLPIVAVRKAVKQHWDFSMAFANCQPSTATNVSPILGRWTFTEYVVSQALDCKT
jgi:hypothetical protein